MYEAIGLSVFPCSRYAFNAPVGAKFDAFDLRFREYMSRKNDSMLSSMILSAPGEEKKDQYPKISYPKVFLDWK